VIIFHVEDDEDIREIAKMALEMTGDFEVVQQDCGEGALSIAADIRPDVLLLDVMMPGATGPETLIKLRKFSHLADVPVIYMTARIQPKEIDALMQTGALGVVVKPFDPMTLGQTILDLIKT
jgi:two-component system phosphate regulon response regulator PhoB